MAVYFWASGLIHSPQYHILKSVMWGLTFVEILSLRSGMQAIGCDGGIREEGLRFENVLTIVIPQQAMSSYGHFEKNPRSQELGSRNRHF
ncbi:hypothetical protein TNCV_1898991 [Trichonephila clavipes]|nr:hypothetical protein TNCV_1898991 [Trichonephila clavipes]